MSMNDQERKRVMEKITGVCEVSERTVYRYLDRHAPKLTRILLSDMSGIQETDMYKTAQ